MRTKSDFPLIFFLKNLTLLRPLIILFSLSPTEYNVSAEIKSESISDVFIATGYLVTIAESFFSNISANSPKI